ncbi:FAD-dependent monooxygenase [Embleya sp. NPDC056575]|uniref:FAD-dependent monooxygenase n=1 Tax=unclassified Embleya TaxID=2699296 RepID=UPI0036A1757C
MSTIAVAGGGIGGLASALALAARGHHVVVCERNAEFAELGAGIQLAPNGMHALDRLGLAEAVARIAVPVGELRFMDGVTGEHVVAMPLDRHYRDRFRNAYVVVHRGELYRLLLDACRSHARIDLRAAHAVVGYAHEADAVRVLLADGASLGADALIGADGLHSAVRAQLVGDGAPRNAGITVYRSIVPMERVPTRLRHMSVTWWAGPGRHFVHYPIAGGRFLNLAPSAENAPAETFSGVSVPASEVLGEFGALCASARRLLELGADWKAWVLVDREPVDGWTDGRVALLGDAAHPMLHYAAQGACMALEDAVVLGELLDCPAGWFTARLGRYNAVRRERTARVHRLARDSIALWHAADAAAEARNRALSAMSPAELYDFVAWLHGTREFAGSPSVTPAVPDPGENSVYTLGGRLDPAEATTSRTPPRSSANAAVGSPASSARSAGTYTLGGWLAPAEDPQPATPVRSHRGPAAGSPASPRGATGAKESPKSL